MQVNFLSTIPEIEEEKLSLPIRKNNIFENAFDSSFYPSNLKAPQTPREIHDMLQKMDNHYDTNFLPWITDGNNASKIASFLKTTILEIHVTPLKLGSVLQAITLNWSVIETSFLFKSCYECITNEEKFSWTAKEWVPVLLSVTSPATIVQFMGLLVWNLPSQDHLLLHPILEVFAEGFGIHQTVSLVRALDQTWVGLVRWNWKLSILKQWGNHFKTFSNSKHLNIHGKSKRRRASESVLNKREKKSLRQY